MDYLSCDKLLSAISEQTDPLLTEQEIEEMLERENAPQNLEHGE